MSFRLFHRASEHFRRLDASITRAMKDVVLVALDSNQQLWPLKSSGSFAAEFAQSMIAPHPGAAWSSPENQQQRREEALRERQRMADYYAELTKTQEERQNAEERERAATLRR